VIQLFRPGLTRTIVRVIAGYRQLSGFGFCPGGLASCWLFPWQASWILPAKTAKQRQIDDAKTEQFFYLLLLFFCII